MIRLPIVGGSPAERSGRSLQETNLPEATLRRVEEMRNLAKGLGASSLFLFGGTLDTWAHKNALAALDFTIAGAFMFPGETISAEGKAAGVFVDVETGSIRFLVNTDQKKSGSAPSYFANGETLSIQAELRDELVARLTEELIRKLQEN